MLEISSKPVSPKRAFLIGLKEPEKDEKDVLILLDELEDLVKTVGMGVASKQLIKIREKNAKYLMGSGKAQEIADLVQEEKFEIVVFDDELSPGQQRNWEQLLKIPVIDRQEVILDIFAKRAHTREAVLQVELARQEYYLPRLKRAWTHLERQRGGGAMQRGVGEKQLEMDQRMVRDRIASLKRELKEVVQHRAVQRQRRMKIPLPTAAIVGYTNAGKSSLLNKLTGAKVFVEDKLFATLDPTTRRLELPNGQVLLITDTVGFVRKLPHRLVEAFKATLEEAVVADFLIHVVDVSSPDLEHHMETTMQVMKELGAKNKQVITVFNKIDLSKDGFAHSFLKGRYPNSCAISVKTGNGISQLLELMEAQLEEGIELLDLLIPYDRYDLIDELHQMGAVKKEKPEEQGIVIFGAIPKRFVSKVQEFKIVGD